MHSQTTSVQIPGLLLVSFMISGQVLSLSVPQILICMMDKIVTVPTSLESCEYYMNWCLKNT